MRRVLLPSLGLALLLASTPLSAQIYIAGSAPYQRPAHASKITQVTKDVAWYQQALHGIYQPYPANLRFLEYQGAWYTPMNHAGMTGPYDIRYWHHNW